MAGKTGRKGKRKKGRGRIALVLTAALLCAQKMPLMAVESDRDNSIRSVSVSDAQIPASTLVIGSYLIHLAGLSDHIYELAKDSAGEFSQNGMYYKSELAEGQWFEITDAASIRDITDAGTPVSASEIEALEFTHQVAANGTVTDLRVQAAVNEFDIPDPYDLTEMEELRPVKMHYQYLQSKETRTESDENYLEIMEIFYGLSIEDDTTRDCDASLDALHPYKLDVAARKKPASWTAAVTTVMEGEDARRRVQSLNTLDLYLDELLKKAGGQDQEGLSPEEMEAFYDFLREQNGEIMDDIDVDINDISVSEDDIDVSNGDGDDGKGEDQLAKWRSLRETYQKFLAKAGTYRAVTLDENFQVDADMIQAIGEAKSNVKTSISKYTGKLLADGMTASAGAIYRYSRELIDCVRGKDTQGGDFAAGRLVDLLNILGGVVEDSDSERASLEDELVDQAFSVWQGILSEGAGGDYRKAEAEGAGLPALTAFLSERESDAESARLEYQAMLTEMWKRMSNSPAQIDAQTRINGMEQLKALPPEDPARSNLLQTVDRHQEWLRKSLAELIAASADSTELDRLVEEQNAMEQQRRNALDENNLAGAKRLSAEMEAGQRNIADLRQELSKTLADPHSSVADKARAAAGLEEGSAGKLISELADNVTSGILGGEERSGLDNNIAALSELARYDPDAAAGAVSQIRDALDSAADTDGATDTDGLPAEELSAQISDIERKISGEETDGLGGGGTGALSEAGLSSLLADYFDGSASASDREKAGALIALSRYAEDTHNQAAKMLAVSTANRLADEDSPYLFEQYDRAASPYVSLKAVGRIFGYRYLFDDAHHIVTLQKPAAYYIFTSGGFAYTFTDGAAGKLSAGAVMQSALYIDSGDGKEIFGCRGYYVPGCSYAVAETTAMEPEIESIYDRLMGIRQEDN